MCSVCLIAGTICTYTHGKEWALLYEVNECTAGHEYPLNKICNQSTLIIDMSDPHQLKTLDI